MNTQDLAEAIAESNKGKAVYVDQNSDGLYMGCNGNFVKTKRAAMRLTGQEVFIKRGLTPVCIKKA